MVPHLFEWLAHGISVCSLDGALCDSCLQLLLVPSAAALLFFKLSGDALVEHSVSVWLIADWTISVCGSLVDRSYYFTNSISTFALSFGLHPSLNCSPTSSVNRSERSKSSHYRVLLLFIIHWIYTLTDFNSTHSTLVTCYYSSPKIQHQST